MKTAASPESYRYCIFFDSVRTGRNFSPALKVLSITEPSSIRRSFVRTNAPPLPGLTCWNSMIFQILPSISIWVPFLNWFVEIVTAEILDVVLGYRAFGGGEEAAHGFLGIAENLAADEAAAFDVPDPGDRHVTDAERATAGVDAPPHKQGAPMSLDDVGGDQQLVPGLFHVVQVLAQAVWPHVGGGAADLLGGSDREELHRRVAEGGDLLRVAAVEGGVEALDQIPVLFRGGRDVGGGR